MEKNYTDEEIIQMVKTGGKSLETILIWLYKQDDWKGKINNFLLKNKATKEDAEDIFQEGLSQFLIMIRGNKYKKASTLKTYLFAICKNIWYNRFSRKRHYSEILSELKQTENNSLDYSTPEFFLLQKEQTERLQNLLAQLGEKCKKIISLWTLGYSIKEIVSQTGYKNENVVSKKKHHCTKELTMLLIKHPLIVDDLLRNKI